VGTAMPNNPAERLLSLYRAGSQGNRAAEPAKKVWAELLEVPENDLPLLLKRIGQVAGIAHDVREQVRRLKGLNPENLITWIPRTLAPFKAYNLDGQFAQFLQPVDENVKSLLQICSDALSQQLPEPEVNREQLQELRTQLAEFVTSLSQMSLPEEPRAFLLKHVAILDNALIDYQLQGFESLTNGLERVIGHAVMNAKKIEEWKEKSPQPFNKIKAIIGVYLVLVTATASTRKLLEDFNFIEPAAATNIEGKNKDR
jgi:hypothetical protein